jgi:hypothetical protein
MGQKKASVTAPDRAGRSDILSRIHPALRENFVPLPEINNALTDEQLASVFGGDWSALRDVMRLVRNNVPEKMDK